MNLFIKVEQKQFDNYNRIDLKYLDDVLNARENDSMIEVTKLDGSKYWVNPHMIESMETNPDLTLSMLSGKKLVLKDTPSEVIERIIAYRKKIGINTQEVL